MNVNYFWENHNNFTKVFDIRKNSFNWLDFMYNVKPQKSRIHAKTRFKYLIYCGREKKKI